MKGTVRFEPGKIEEAQVKATIGVASIDTQVDERDEHLMSPEFLHAEKYPGIFFRSKRVRNVRAGGFDLVGDLTLRGVTREVVLRVDGPGPEVRDRRGVVRRDARARVTISRRAFGLVWKGALERLTLVEDEIQVTAEVRLVKKERPASGSPPGRADRRSGGPHPSQRKRSISMLKPGPMASMRPVSPRRGSSERRISSRIIKTVAEETLPHSRSTFRE